VIRAGIVGGSGYIGGELLRLLLFHPQVEVVQASSDRLRGQRIDSAHPHLRSRTDLTFRGRAELTDCDVLFFAAPHRETMTVLPKLAGLAEQIIDLSGDFRLRDTEMYERHYGVTHAFPELLADFTPGLPELGNREALRTADRISVPGCMATAAMLALAPLAELVEPDVFVDARTGSSGSGAGSGSADSHPQRSGAMRVFAPAGHRHEAEIEQATGLNVRMSATGVEAVRGVQVVCALRPRKKVSELDVRRAYRSFYRDEPFVRIVAHRRGAFRYPDPKILLGSNYCDVGFAVGEGGTRITAIGALDNLVKGGAGAAVQCLNIRMGWPETLGLEFPGLHPI
jgi:N-acetyl-gamma-glutamyl-phosphate/LysW-gamma-L-alpha-aminoadipyl-6-phosphate reductase